MHENFDKYWNNSRDETLLGFIELSVFELVFPYNFVATKSGQWKN